MHFVRCADKAVVAYIHHLPQLADSRNDSVNILLRRYALFLGNALNFLPVLVRAGKKHNVITLRSFVARNRVCRNSAVRMTYMQLIARIIYRRCDIKLFLCHT